jgi:hypothetical protein
MVSVKHGLAIAVLGAAALMLLQPSAKLLPKAHAATVTSTAASTVSRQSWSAEWYTAHKSAREDAFVPSSF